jgi:hypothetical protein
MLIRKKSRICARVCNNVITCRKIESYAVSDNTTNNEKIKMTIPLLSCVSHNSGYFPYIGQGIVELT